MKHSVQAWGVHLWWSLKVDLQDLHPPTENTIYGPETLHVQSFILFTTFPNILHHTERSKAANQILWHSFSEGELAKLAIIVMCWVCKSALTSQLTSLEWELTISYDAITALRHSEGISWKRRSNSRIDPWYLPLRHRRYANKSRHFVPHLGNPNKASRFSTHCQGLENQFSTEGCQGMSKSMMLFWPWWKIHLI